MFYFPYMDRQSVKINVTPEVRSKVNEVKEQMRRDYSDRKIRTSEALEILIDHYQNRFD